MIKKFNNGNITLKFDNMEEIDIDNFYNNEMTMNDLYFNQINGYMYLVDYNTSRMYDFSDCYVNILVYLKEEMQKNNGKIKIYPIKKKECKQLFVDLENGF